MRVPVGKLISNPNNPRFIKDENFKKLVQSLKELPIMLNKRPILIDEDNMIIGGNMRFKAAKEAGMKDLPVELFTKEDAEENNRRAREIDPNYIDKTYEEQRNEMIIKDNVSGGEWDWDLLANEWSESELEEWGLDLPAGFNQQEIEEDEAPELDNANPPVSKLGEIYQLGRHRVMCGDSTSEDDTNNLLEQQQIDLYITDPPYNVDYTGKTKDALKINNDQMDDEEFLAFLIDANLRADEHMKHGASFYIFHADLEGYNFRASVKSVGWLLKQVLVWVKQSMVMGRQDYQWKHEPILYGWKSGSSHSWYADRKQTTLIEFDRPSRNEEHPTMKPISILAYLINNSSKAGDLVFDNFLGSGSTLIACEQTNRICYGMEIDPKYVDVIRKRYWKFINNNNEQGWEENTPVITQSSEITA